MGWVAGIEEGVEEVHTEVVFIFWTIVKRGCKLTPFPVAENFVICMRVFNLRYCAPNLTLGHAPLCSLILS